jgi:predicted neutral ceramidase superfamily lipid hydrolase
MTSYKMRSALQALTQGNEHRSVIAHAREVFDDIEAALAASISRKAIVDALAEQGLRSTTLHRIRSRRFGLPTSSEDTSRVSERATRKQCLESRKRRVEGKVAGILFRWLAETVDSSSVSHKISLLSCAF